ncbi:DUF4142 domain-containing protein [Pseudoduganella violacea]|uniref:Putative membrane protein n=1 Tax=Pseudoduganella violacea TaxID=1715466 RepID=A0A7W5FV15_9BURK|nr:DUF4142 domain-containing protein [Pseudoduganella violacea]MBB3120307.1 putative membrane protein [Pseudoduganella violacea]
MDKAKMWQRGLGASLLAALLAAGGASAQALNKGDQRLLNDLAQANMAEVEVARIALQKSQNEQVRSFAQQMIDDHGKGLDAVKQVAQNKGVNLAAEPDSKQKALAQKLQALSGEQFDRQYLEQAGVQGHRQAHALVSKVQKQAKDADVKALAAQLQPTVDQHLSQVQQLNASLKSGTSAGSSGTEGRSGSGEPGLRLPPGERDSSGNPDNPLNPAQPTKPANPDIPAKPVPKPPPERY